MANYKKFIYVSNKAGILDGTSFESEALKFAYVFSQASEATGKWYKSIIFREATGEIYNRGKKYGVSAEDAQRITDLETAVEALENAKASLDASSSIIYKEAEFYKEGDELPEGKEVGDVKTPASYEVALDSILGGDNKTIDVTDGVASINSGVGIKFTASTMEKGATIALYDKDGGLLGEEVEVSDLVGTGILRDSVYDKETGILTLKFSDGTATGTTDVDVNLSNMLDINDVVVADDSKDYLGVNLEGEENSQAVFSVKTKTLGSAVGLTKNDEGQWVTADGEITEDGLATAADVAAEIVADEEVIALALNDHETRLKNLEDADAITTTVEKEEGSEITVTDNGEGNDHAYTIGVTKAVYENSEFSADGLVDNATLMAYIEDANNDWEEF